MEPIGYAMLIGAAVILAALNYYVRKDDREYRATLSPEERKALDDDDQAERQLW